MSDPYNTSLKKITLFNGLTDEELEKLSKLCVWRRYMPDEPIIDRQSDNQDVCFIVEGRVRVVNHSLSGKEISFEDIDAGRFIGELSAIDEQPRSATVIALNTTLAAFMPASTFLKVVTESPSLSLEVMKRMAAIIRTSTARIMDLSTLGANNRVHAEILRLGTNARRADNTARISPIPIHSDIASRVSTTRETVARVLSDLSRQDLVVKDGRALVITDFDKMKNLVEDVRGE